jgi:hypothetical protein
MYLDPQDTTQRAKKGAPKSKNSKEKKRNLPRFFSKYGMDVSMYGDFR